MDQVRKAQAVLFIVIYNMLLAFVAFGFNFWRDVSRNFRTDEYNGRYLFCLQILVNTIASITALLWLHYFLKNKTFKFSRPSTLQIVLGLIRVSGPLIVAITFFILHDVDPLFVKVATWFLVLFFVQLSLAVFLTLRFICKDE
ncbi:unnamed protein product [Bursaphelenchus xylophilus]|uniref:(pine wood nematode) hypothetical protein n=1 Tax=Bursaphelenchus xylophilus TaxID=6326 RepID=A0A1I7S557_BURXY|nr:unnamed protein product [Bursaphelenchus xylophilus]CAG9117727.1 unnamed protein product [Bursaphelenchus xylophilus]